ncbi:type I polyketide synthase [Dactylosporangium sp. NPDC005572]|uniref:type I polyketide synthase n=1 Tax=Dactylosporangium sp. NPDC005572 TaxID=3156889 RepID=UPI0033B40EA9
MGLADAAKTEIATGRPAGEPIAVIGVACRLPGAEDPAAFWRLLRAGGDAVGAAPPDRGLPDGTVGGFLDRVDGFDAAFFRMSPREAAATDPRQRLMLELSWEALEDARILPGSLAGSRTGVYLGTIWDDYAALTGLAPSEHSMAGVGRGIVANRVSHALGLRGPSLVVDTGQSSSLVGVQLAMESLRRGETDLAIAGGVNLILAPHSELTARRFGGLSPTGRSRAFDERADGFVRGEGGAALVLKPLSRAEADGDRVYGVLLGAAVNNDGPGDALTVPTVPGQRDVIAAACRDAGVEPAAVRYVELHGTGTRVGDPIEAAALGAALGAHRAGGAPLAVGSVKTNVGHLEGGAGIVGLLKTVLSVWHRHLPASLHFQAPNPQIPLAELGLRVQAEPGEWPGGEGPLVAGVSSFGMGGTNCHVVVASAAVPPDGPETGEPPLAVPVVLSGASEAALRRQAERLRDHLRDEPGTGPADVAWTLATTRTQFPYRAAVVGRTAPELLAGLDAIAAGLPAAGALTARASTGGRLAVLFPGQGAQRLGMGRDLAAASPAFARALHDACDALDPHLDRPLRDVMWADPDGPNAGLLQQTGYTQPALFAVERALYRLVETWGVEADLLAGHSIGELTAAHVAGVLDLDDAARLVTTRARLMQQLPPGAMASVAAAPDTLAALLAEHPGVEIAAVNAADATVLAGRPEAIDAVVVRLEASGVKVRRLAVSRAFHTADIEAALPDFVTAIAGLPYRAPRIPVVSNLTGEPATRLTEPQYWAEHARHAVRFADGVATLAGLGVTHWLELGPSPALTPMVRRHPEAGRGHLVTTLRPDRPEPEAIAGAAAALHASGRELDWTGVLSQPGRPVDLPTYGFVRQRHWLTPAGTAEPAPAARRPEAPEAVAGPALDVLVRGHVAAVLGVADPAEVDGDRPLRDLGFDSVLTMELADRLGTALGRTVPVSLIYDHPTLDTLAAGLRPGDDDEEFTAARADDGEPIAIVAMACRYPGGVRSPEQLWRLVADGGDGITGLPTNRGWDLDGLAAQGIATRFGGFLHDADEFDADFFGISAREAASMDPQQRLLLETSWEAFERAGIDPAGLSGQPVGVFVGAMSQEYGPRLTDGDDATGGYLLTGNTASVASGRLAYVFGLQGPAVTVDTACSSSLVALHLAGRALRSGECDLALAGGVCVMAAPGMFVELTRQGALAPDGRCKSFGDGADGTGWSEGVGMLVLERLADARANGHEVLAVVRGSAVNNDGASNGLTAPNGVSQQRVIRRALADAGLAPSDVDAVEAHGTGTRLGDPIEAGALLATYGRDRPADRPLWLGSLKSNIGHTQAAAGVAGVIKMVEAMRNGRLPRTLHADRPSPHIDWSGGAVALLTEARPWPEPDTRPRRAAVSSFGISGTNAHLILEEGTAAVPAPPPGDDEPAGPVPLLLSARSGDTVEARAAQLADLLDDETVRPDRAAWSLAALGALPHRAAVVGTGRSALRAGLAHIAAGPGAAPVAAPPADGPEEPATVVRGVARPGRIAFVYPGQGAQWAGMASRLLDESPVFAARIAACAAALEPWIDWSLEAVLRGEAEDWLEHADVLQPANWAMMMGLTALWAELGVHPDAVVGHSQGEVAAACAAGAFDLAEAARIVALRGRTMQALAGTGGMASVALPADEVRARLAGYEDKLQVAVANGPAATVVAGDPGAAREFVEACLADGLRARVTDADYASHTAHVEVVRDELLAALGAVEPAPGRVPFYSTVSGDVLDTGRLTGEYWYENLRRTVEFDTAVRALARDGHTLFVEVSPHPILTTAVDDILDGAGAAVGTLRRDDGGPARILAAAAGAWCHGARVDWPHAPASRRRVTLPPYPFRRRRFWLTGATGGDPSAWGAAPTGHPLAGVRMTLAEDDGFVLSGPVSEAAHPWLSGHVAAGQVLVPGTALLELALHAAETAGAAGVAELTVEAALAVPPGSTMDLQMTVAGPDAAGDRRFSIHARPRHGDGPWTRHAGGVLAADLPGEPTPEPGPWPPTGAAAEAMDDVYPQLAGAGYEYGETFRGLHAMWRHGDELFAGTRLAADLPTAGFGLHPAVLDAALHPLLPRDAGSATIDLPFAFHDVRLHARGADALRVRLSPAGPGTYRLRADDPAGAPVLTGQVTLRPARLDQLRPGGRGAPPLYEVVWPVQPADAAADPGQLRVVAAPAGPDLHAVVAATLTLVQEHLAADDDGLLAVTTVGAVETLPGDVVDPVQSAVWGLVRSAQTERPGRLVLVDLAADDTGDGLEVGVRAAVAGGADQIAWRRGTAHVPRLAVAAPPLPVPAERPWRLEVSETRTVADVALRPYPAAGRPLGDGEIRLDVRAVGLNFRDVLMALGMYPGADEIGSEAAGVVAEVGPGVTGLAPGDRVFGPFRDAAGTTAVVDHRLALPVPDGWSYAQAAAVPVTYSTAYDALVHVADVRPGDRVLIHAAAGGVGMAATQIARRLGAEVFVTASPGKWATLRADGYDDAHLASSRTTEFAARFRATTAGHGMDVVLNCLAGELTDESLALLAAGGRFVEIGKNDLRPADEVARRYPGITYQHFDLFEEPEERLHATLATILEWFAAGDLVLPPLTVLDVRRAPTAFRHLQQALHTGKLVLTVPPPARPDGTVLVTGGTGLLGGLLAEHLVRTGRARHLLLASRSGPGAAGDLPARLEALGATVDVVACDVAERDQVAALLAAVPAERPLTTILHAAGVLRDGAVTGLTAEQLGPVLRPKSDAARHLDELTRGGAEPPELVLFSSAVGTLGGAGQANYAAANTYLDGLAARRRAAGFPATSVAWGLWAPQSGMTGEMSRADLERIGKLGLAPIPAEEGLALYDGAVAAGRAHIVAARLDTRRIAAADVVPGLLRDLVTARPRTAATGRDATGGLAGRIAATPLAQRLPMLADLVRTQAGAVLVHPDPAGIDPGVALKDLGFDSLTSVELRNRLANATGLKLPSTIVFRHPTISALAAHLLELLAGVGTRVGVPQSLPRPLAR